jgi:hypothetical protein
MPSRQITMAGLLPKVSLETSSFSNAQWLDEGMSRGSASNSDRGRTSIKVGHFGVPRSRTNFSIEIAFGADMASPSR